VTRGILVDDTLQTFDPSIYAVGECVQHRRQTFGLVAPLWEQARISAQHIAEIGVSRFSGAVNATQLKVSGIEVFSAGDFAESPTRDRWCFRTSVAASTSAWCSKATASAARCCSATRGRRRASRS
jgi:nitrite reductase (NADH) large subunit